MKTQEKFAVAASSVLLLGKYYKLKAIKFETIYNRTLHADDNIVNKALSTSHPIFPQMRYCKSAYYTILLSYILDIQRERIDWAVARKAFYDTYPNLV